MQIYSVYRVGWQKINDFWEADLAKNIWPEEKRESRLWNPIEQRTYRGHAQEPRIEVGPTRGPTYKDWRETETE